MTCETRPLLVKNGRIIDPSQQIDEIINLLVLNGKIADIGNSIINLSASDYQIIDADGLIICPGFIDLHCHLRQPGNEEKETIATGTKAASKGGFTTICCMPNTIPPLDSPELIDYVKSIALKEGIIRVLPIGCITEGRKGRKLVDFLKLAEAGAIAVSDDGSPVLDNNIMTSALKNSIHSGIPVIDHCENTSISVTGWDMNGGALANKLGLRGMPDSSEEDMILRDVRLNKHIGGKLHIAHVSTAGSVDLIRRAKQDGCYVTSEVTPNHITLTENDVSSYNTNTKVNPPLRNLNDIEALVNGLNDNTIDVIATDHAPHAEKDKKCTYKDAAFGISTFETAFGSLMRLVHDRRLTLNTLIAKLTCNPAKIIGNHFSNLGSISTGKIADITMFDPEKEWVVNTDNFISKGKNSPWNGVTMKGKIMATVYNGEVVYQDEKLNISKG